MATWTQYTLVTYADGTELEHEPKKRTADEIIGLMAQAHFLKDDGEDITVDIGEVDEMLRAISYTMIRKMSDRVVKHRYVRN